MPAPWFLANLPLAPPDRLHRGFPGNLGVLPEEARSLVLILAFLAMDVLLLLLVWRAMSRSPGPRGPGHVAGRAMLGLGAAVVMVGAADVVLQSYLASGPQRMTLPDADVFWRLNPRFSREYNHLGLRERELPLGKPSGQWRILSVGDSSIYGDQVAPVEAFPRVLEGMLREACPGADLLSINGGVPGYSSLQGVEWLRRCLAWYRPDVVIVAYFNSDVVRDILPDSERLAADGASQALRRALFHSHLYLWMRQEIAALRAAEGPLPEASITMQRVPADAYRANLLAMARLIREAGAAPILLELPPDRALPPQPAHRLVLREVARGEGIPLADAAAAWARTDAGRLYADSVHPNAAGHLAIAATILETLRRAALLPSRK